MREHATSVHLMLDPDDAGQLDVGARQHPTHPNTFFLTVDSLRCHITLSGQPEPLVGVVERLRAELAATLAAAGRHPPDQAAAAAERMLPRCEDLMGRGGQRVYLPPPPLSLCRGLFACTARSTTA